MPPKVVRDIVKGCVMKKGAFIEKKFKDKIKKVIVTRSASPTHGKADR